MLCNKLYIKVSFTAAIVNDISCSIMNTTTLSSSASASSAAYTIGNEIEWISQNIFGRDNSSKRFDFVRLYEKLFRYNRTLKDQFLQNVLVTMSRHQLENSYCYRMLSMATTSAANAAAAATANDGIDDIFNSNNNNITTNNQLRHFSSACNEYKILVAVVGFHSNFVSQCYELKTDNIMRMAEILPVYERHSPAIVGYVNHLTNLQQTLGFKLNVIWPQDLNSVHAVDVFLKACKRSS